MDLVKCRIKEKQSICTVFFANGFVLNVTVSSMQWARGTEHLGGMNDMPKELRAINMDEGQEQQNDSTGGLGNMPELTLLLEDDDVVKKFSVSHPSQSNEYDYNNSH